MHQLKLMHAGAWLVALMVGWFGGWLVGWLGLVSLLCAVVV
jgi:hypothetical protein